MCDTRKYYHMYQEIKLLEPSDTLQLMLESQNVEEREFFEFLGDFLLQQKQKELVDRNAF